MSSRPTRPTHEPFGRPIPSPLEPASFEADGSERPVETDVFIVGGGPAGLACGIACALRGLRVMVADGMQPPIDKACGEGLLPDALRALAALGIDLSTTESAPIAGISFLGARDRDGRLCTATGSFRRGMGGRAEIQSGSLDEVRSRVQSERETAGSHGVGVRRVLLHELLIRRAESLGVQLYWRTSVHGVQEVPGGHGHVMEARQEEGRRTIRFHARYVVGADGHRSRVRAWAGLERARRGPQRLGLRQHYALAPWSDHVEVHWGAVGQASVTPVSPSQVCVAFVTSKRFATAGAALAHFPELAGRLASSAPSDHARGSISFSRRLRRVRRGNIVLVGDASGSVDAVAGEGLSLSFRQSLALADAIVNDDLPAYERAHRKLLRAPLRMAGALLWMGRSPHARGAVLRILRRFPALFDLLLRFHVSNTAPADLYTRAPSPVASNARASATS